MKEKSYKNYDWIYNQYITLNKSVYTIAKEYDTTHSTIFLWLKRLNIPTRKLAIKDKNIIISYEHVHDGYIVKQKSAKDIGKQFGVSDMYIFKLLKEFNIDVRSNAKTYSSSAVSNNIKHNYFSKYVNNYTQLPERILCLLGFFFADGSVSSSANRITIKLHKNDKEVLDLYNADLFYIPVDYYTYKNYLDLSFASKQIKNDLIELGIVPNKTYSEITPNYLCELSLEQKISWLWGFICGDGHISKRNKYVSFVNHKSSGRFLDNLLKSINSNFTYHKFNKNNSTRFNVNKNFTLFLAENIKNLVETNKIPMLLERKYNLLIDKLN